MAGQRFSVAFREALWLAHKELCLFCERPVAFREMQVDHLIAESTNAEQLADLRRRLGLASEFALTGLENLGPSCAPCNRNKHKRQLADGAIMIKLAQIASRAPKVMELLKQKKVTRDIDNILRLIQHSVDAGEFTPGDMGRAIGAYLRNPDGIWGASGLDRTAPSPEERFRGMRFLDDGRAFIAPSAAAFLRREKISPKDLIRLIQFSAKSGHLKAHRAGADRARYEVKTAGNLRLVFSVEQEGVTVESVYRKGALGRPRREVGYDS